MKKLMPLELFVDTLNTALYQAEGKTLKSACWAFLKPLKNGAQTIEVSCASGGKELEQVEQIMKALMRPLYRDYIRFEFSEADSPVNHAVYAECGTYFYRDATIEYNFDSEKFMINYFGEEYNTLKEAQLGVDEWIKQGIDFTKELEIEDCKTKIKDSSNYWQMVQRDYDLTDEDMVELAQNYRKLRDMILEAVKFAQTNNLIAYAPAGTCDDLYKFKESVKDLAFSTRDFIKK